MSRHHLRGRAFYDLGRFTEAAREFAQEAGRRDGDQALSLALLALSELKMGRLDLAQTSIRNAQAVDPTHLGVLTVLAHIALEKRDFEEGRALLATLRQREPNNADVLSLGALFELFAGRPSAALQLADEGLALDPENEDCLDVVVHALLQINEDELATKWSERLARVNPLSPIPHALRAENALAKGEQDAARSHALEALRLCPTMTWARAVLLWHEHATLPFSRLLNGVVGPWKLQRSTVIVALFIPMIPVAAYNNLNPNDPIDWLARLVNPLVLLGLGFATVISWPSLWASVRSLLSRDARAALGYQHAEAVLRLALGLGLGTALLLYIARASPIWGVSILIVFLFYSWRITTHSTRRREWISTSVYLGILAVGSFLQLQHNQHAPLALLGLVVLNLILAGSLYLRLPTLLSAK